MARGVRGCSIEGTRAEWLLQLLLMMTLLLPGIDTLSVRQMLMLMLLHVCVGGRLSVSGQARAHACASVESMGN